MIKEKKIEKKSVTVRLQTELSGDIEIFAKKERRTKTSMAEILMEKGIEQYKKELK